MKRVFELLEEIESLLNLEFAALQSFQSMYDTFDINKTAIVSGSQVVMKQKCKTHLQFITIIPPGWHRGFVEHWHDCREVCTVISGEMKDLLLPTVYANEGGKIDYPAYQKHMPYNAGISPLVIKVDFYK